MRVWKTITLFLRALVMPKCYLALENLALRQQLAVCIIATRVLRDRQRRVAGLIRAAGLPLTTK